MARGFEYVHRYKPQREANAEPIRFTLDNLVTFARQRFELRSIQYRDVAAVVFNHPLLL